MTVAEHLVATTRGHARLLLPKCACWLWARLRALFPDALSAVLMPDHIHLVTRPGAVERFKRLLAAFTARFGVRFDVLPVQPAHSARIAFRAVRYGFLNPVRGDLVDDPWAWPWSTLRDVAGAAHPIWTPAPALARTLALSPKTLLADVTTGDDGVRFAPPHAAPVATATFDALRSAVASTLRLPVDELRDHALARRLAVQATAAIGMPYAHRLAEAFDCCERTIRRDREVPHSALDAVLVCLGDPRLLRGPDAVANAEARRGRGR